jgi:hypothetical protein
MALFDEFKAAIHNPIRRCYIKRIQNDGTYETDWYRIDKINGRGYIVDWGSFTLQLDIDKGKIGGFCVTSVSMRVDNKYGFFNSENDSRSLWTNFIGRAFTKIKIETGYLSSDGTEINVATDYEGYIDKIVLGDKNISTIRIFAYQNIFTRYNISDLTLLGNKTVNQIINLITGQTKISKYYNTINASAADQNITIDTSKLEGTYWDVINDLASASNSIPLPLNDTFSFIPRAIGEDLKYTFCYGKATQTELQINSNSISYDDEGSDRVVLRFQAKENNALYSYTNDVELQRKYPDNTLDVDLSLVVSDNDKQLILDALLSEWQFPKPTVSFETNYLLNEIVPLDKIQITSKGIVEQSEYPTYDDGSLYDQTGLYYVDIVGSIIINRSYNWKVVSVTKNINKWTTTINAEKDPLGQPAVTTGIYFDSGYVYDDGSVYA